MKKTLLLCWLLVGVTGALRAQVSYVSGQALFQLQKGYSLDDLLQRAQAFWGRDRVTCSRVAEALDIWLLDISPPEEHARDLLSWLNTQPEVRVAQHNHRIESRHFSADITPDDPFYNSQWHHRNTGAGGGVVGADLASEQAWDITTGGLTPQGDTIVLAIVDSGIDALHEDLSPNMWYNWAEIPGDGIDNDQNGYVDDFRGWNVSAQNDQISGISTTHGTPIAALAGARGNNNTGIAGVNWAVKVLFVAGSSTEDVILAAFDYVLRARRRHNATQGKQGAFVVAVNCSWGINGGKPSDAPLWCAAFDSLGSAGILSIAATANLPVDVDTYGDLPTTCPSDFLISVTSLTRQNQKASDAAWGAVSIDLGAYGEGVFSARPNNNYGAHSGTSFATPLVAGAIALLYAAPCNNLAAMAEANPAAAALWVKNHLLYSTEPLPSVQGITVSGGRLHLFNMLKSYEDQCQPCVPPFGITATAAAKDTLRLSWSVVSSATTTTLRWREKGTLEWNTVPNAQSPFVLRGLKPCTDYEISLQTFCGLTASSPWTPPVIATTAGCCTAPTGLFFEETGANLDLLKWEPSDAAFGYLVRLTYDDGTVETFSTAQNYLYIGGLLPCLEIKAEVVALCHPDITSSSATFTFTTSGCGPCLDRDYCSAGATDATNEWIGLVQIGAWSHEPTSGKGYLNQADINDDMPELSLDMPTPILLKPAYAAQPYREHFRVYVDYNGDGDFLDANELAFDPGFPVTDAVEGAILPPSEAQSGITRMRVLMKYRGVSGTPPKPCEQFEFGQVVDYCVRILEPTSTHSAPLVRLLRIFPNPAQHQIFIEWKGEHPELARLRLFDAAGRLARRSTLWLDASTPTALDLTGLPPGLFWAEITTQTAHFREKILVTRR